MLVNGIDIPEKSLTNYELEEYANELKIPYFRGVFMRDTLPKRTHKRECGIVNLNTSKESGSHWVAYQKDGNKRIYFDSFGQITPWEIQKYLKTNEELERGKGVIQRNTDIVQAINTNVCGHLCLFVLKSLTEGLSFQEVINKLTNGYP